MGPNPGLSSWALNYTAAASMANVSRLLLKGRFVPATLSVSTVVESYFAHSLDLLSKPIIGDYARNGYSILVKCS